MSKGKIILSRLCGYALVLFGLMDIIALVSYYALIPFDRISSNVTSSNVKHTIISHLVITSLIAILFGVSFIISGLGVLRFREWARKLSIWTLVLHLLVLVPVAPAQQEIGVVRILFMCISLLIIYLLSKRTTKDLLKEIRNRTK